MDRNAALAVLLPALLLHGCDQRDTPSQPSETTSAVPAVGRSTPAGAALPAPAGANPPAGYTDREGVNEGYPNLTPPALTAEAEKGQKGARNVLLSFARAIELKAFDQAWAMLSPTDREQWSKTQFAAIFAHLGKIAAAIGKGEGDAGAGSLFYIAPVTITANDKEGRPVRIEGEARLRRVNDVDGATREQLRWHFERLTLDWTH